jgi:hypothetical protein
VATHPFTVQYQKDTWSSSNFYFNVALKPISEISSDLPPFYLGHTADSHFSHLSSGLTPADCAIEAGHNSMESLFKTTAPTKQSTLQPVRSRVVTKKTVVKTMVKSRPAPASAASGSVDLAAKIERPTRKAAQKCRVLC